METTEIQTLLQAYVRHGSESAFRELVQRYLGLVYSTALRHFGGQTHLAEDVAQTVFTDFARKARILPPDVLLGGWLHKHTCFVASNVSRAERRRAIRENQAAQMNTFNDNSDENWKKIAPVLDDAINELNAEDRDAVMLRYFEQRDFRSIGATLGVSDDTAQKRVSRAVEKLRNLLGNHGITLTATALASLLANQAVGALPASLAGNIAGTALTKSTVSARAPKSFLTAKIGLALVALMTFVAFTPLIVSRISKKVSAVEPAKTVPVTASAQTNEKNPASEKSSQVAVSNPALAATANNSTSSNRLSLTILSAISGRPIPNATIEFGAQAEKWVTKKLTADRFGVCDVEILPDLKTLELTTQINGFADTRLSWNVERGEKIPQKYTLALDRAVLIGGRVLGPNDEPIAGAKVGFNHDDDPVSKKLPESHEFGGIEVKTDSEGRWQINRIAEDMLHRLDGRAKHTNYVDSESITVSRQPELEAQLRDRSHIFRLGKATTIHGVVLNADDLPVAGAKVFFGGRQMSFRRETKSLADGSFVLPGCKPAKDILTAEAKGFAASTIEIDPMTNFGPYQLRLQPGKILRLLVVDKNGAPVSRANVWLDTLANSFPNSPGPKPVQANFEGRADGGGRLVWDSAPEGELKFYVHKSGYMSVRDLKLEANNEEHVVTLPPALVVSGTVKNESGQPIPRFKIICGYPQKYFEPSMLKENWNPSWSNFSHDWLNFAGGNYRHSFEDPMIFGTKNPGYLLKFEAEGYADFVSRVLAPDDGEVKLDVILRKAATPIVTVLLADGSPAVRADVGLVSVGSKLSFIPGGFSRENIQNGAALLTTDEKGQFRLPRDEAVSRVIIAHGDGYVDTTAQTLASSPQVYLQPWGALEGTYLSGGKPLVGRELKLGFENESEMTLSYNFENRVKTDSQGHFVFPKLLPGKHKLIALIPQKSLNPTTSSWKNLPMQDVEIHSGQTTEVTLGNSGYAVVAHILFPKGFKREAEMQIFASIHAPFPMPSQEILNNPEALKEWQQKPEIKRLSQAPQYTLEEKSDGSWSAENVLAGDYQITVMAISFEKAEAGKTTVSWRGQISLTVPETPATGTIDVGTIEPALVPSR